MKSLFFFLLFFSFFFSEKTMAATSCTPEVVLNSSSLPDFVWRTEVHHYMPDTLRAFLCEGEAIQVGSNLYEQSGTYIDTLLSTQGTDSVVVTIVEALPDVKVASPVVSVCAGESAVLLAQNATTYAWTPAAGLSNPAIPNPVASPAQTTTYYVTAVSYGENLVVNGDFEAGNTGFFSQYTYEQGPIMQPGMYFVGDEPEISHPVFVACEDHTTGSGNMFFANGSVFPNISIVWQQQISLTPNSDYLFSVWVQNITASQILLPELQFFINGIQVAPDFSPDPNQCVWTNFSTIWNSGNSTSALLTIIDQNLSSPGNDFALDDISLRKICTTTDSVTVQVFPPVSSTVSASVCFGDSYQLPGGAMVIAPGTYTDVLTTQNGCDSTVVTTLSVVLPAFFSQNIVLCQGESIQVGNEIYSQTGIFLDTLQTLSGCDSIVTTSIIVNPSPSAAQAFTICQGETIMVNGNIYSQSGIYTDIFQTAAGCDSTVVTTLVVLPAFDFSQNVTICQGETWQVGGNTYSQSGTYNDVFQSWQGCDSTLQTVLTVVPPVFNTISAAICEGETFQLGNTSYAMPGIFQDTLQGWQGCDSIVSLNLSITSLQATLAVVPPGCSGNKEGSVTVSNVGGGLSPYLFALNNQAFYVTDSLFENLDPGNYKIWVEDAAGCRKAFPFVVDEPAALVLTLPAAYDIELGDSVQLNPILNFVPDSVFWTGTGSLDCPTCLQPYVRPFESAIYRLWLRDADGCTAEAQTSVNVRTVPDVYVPNVFSPNNDGLNDRFTIFAGQAVQLVRQFRVFNRWGAVVFHGENFTPNELSLGWDGTFKGKPAGQGVFTWMAEVEYIDGRKQIFAGEVILLK